MIRRIAIIGTLDTKGEEVQYIKELIERHGHQAIVIDTGILGEPPFKPTVTHQQVAQASGVSLEEIIAFGNEGKAIAKMAEGAAKVIKKLYSNGELDGVLALGATMGTSLGLTVTKALPIGLPKLIVSTIAFSAIITPDAACGDLMMMQWPGGFWGLNSISRETLDKATEAILGAADAYKKRVSIKMARIGVTSLGIRGCRYMSWVRPALEQKGYEVVAFHTDGMGGRVFEQAIAEGLIDAALDLSAFEFSRGEHRECGLHYCLSQGLPGYECCFRSGSRILAS